MLPLAGPRKDAIESAAASGLWRVDFGCGNQVTKPSNPLSQGEGLPSPFPLPTSPARSVSTRCFSVGTHLGRCFWPQPEHTVTRNHHFCPVQADACCVKTVLTAAKTVLAAAKTVLAAVKMVVAAAKTVLAAAKTVMAAAKGC